MRQNRTGRDGTPVLLAGSVLGGTVRDFLVRGVRALVDVGDAGMGLGRAPVHTPGMRSADRGGRTEQGSKGDCGT